VFKKKVNENKLWGMPSIVDHQNQIVYLKCSSAITAMGISAIVKKFYPGYTGKIASREYFEKLKGQLVN
jgi:hypothetical protein